MFASKITVQPRIMLKPTFSPPAVVLSGGLSVIVVGLVVVSVVVSVVVGISAPPYVITEIKVSSYFSTHFKFVWTVFKACWAAFTIEARPVSFW